MLIAFWSPYHGQTGTTSATISLGITMAMTANHKVLLGHTHYERSTMERCLLPPIPGQDVSVLEEENHGLYGLKRLIKHGRLAPEAISNYTTPLLKERRLDLLMGAKARLEVHGDEEALWLHQIFMNASLAYDLVMVDVHSGMNQGLGRHVLESADLIVVCLNQNKWLLEDYFSNRLYKEFIEDPRVIYHIGAMAKGAHLSLKNIRKNYSIDKVVGVPFDLGFMESANEGRVLEYLLRHNTVSKKQETYPYIQSLKGGSDLILRRLDQLSEGVFNYA